MMKRDLQDLIASAVATLTDEGVLTHDFKPAIQIDRTKDTQHGDFACNIALVLAKQARRKPRELAELIVGRLPESAKIMRVEIAGPGFINFFMTPAAFQSVVGEVLDAGEAYGHSPIGDGKSVLVEFVSANPTGPLHVGHGRGAAYGAAVADLLAAAGFKVHREYYVNDAGRQMDILAASVWLRYLELCGEAIIFPTNGYKGDYVFDIASDLHREHSDAFRRASTEVMADLPADAAPDGSGDKEAHIDAVIAKTKRLLGEEDYRKVFVAGLNTTGFPNIPW
jgi:arginyl-tRNA synthetase